MLSICLLVSGKLGIQSLQYIHQNSHHVSAVFTDKNSFEVIRFCKSKDIPLYIGNPRNGKSAAFIRRLECDILLSINYLFIIEQDLIDLPRQYAINIHGSLLPKYRGRTPHVWAIINGENETGITAHLIAEGVDRGAIVKQIKIPIREQDKGVDILTKFQVLYPKLIDSVLSDIKENRIELITQDETKATYFGKRTPADGKINWEWSKERIRNWIRAQSKPYPGAFSYYENSKLVIHWAEYCDEGYHYQDLNGSILRVLKDGLIVKTPNGALHISNIEGSESIEFQKGDILI